MPAARSTLAHRRSAVVPQINPERRPGPLRSDARPDARAVLIVVHVVRTVDRRVVSTAGEVRRSWSALPTAMTTRSAASPRTPQPVVVMARERAREVRTRPRTVRDRTGLPVVGGEDRRRPVLTQWQFPVDRSDLTGELRPTHRLPEVVAGLVQHGIRANVASGRTGSTKAIDRATPTTGAASHILRRPVRPDAALCGMHRPRRGAANARRVIRTARDHDEDVDDDDYDGDEREAEVTCGGRAAGGRRGRSGTPGCRRGPPGRGGSRVVAARRVLGAQRSRHGQRRDTVRELPDQVRRPQSQCDATPRARASGWRAPIGPASPGAR